MDPRAPPTNANAASQADRLRTGSAQPGPTGRGGKQAGESRAEQSRAPWERREYAGRGVNWFAGSLSPSVPPFSHSRILFRIWRTTYLFSFLLYVRSTTGRE
ncbi:hypothetical protein BO70DRAFT_366041 [Aspergillus heteromorphus CBS 117.55]|uniref:Uncharacterized protein n=1 Tax=Aspergillus heteromorphus CBS 117.55 TaxID=1448321 RepID=A0A317V325_9EURO|nr:uncharacterized protein BO70DRAFT_366041 [Aspergillus heteromorphus CBS 117.55]PWY68674.1 hypothetical protein BO70DRAFT_366041 [Aspergillus heteromorphus CBS 117.55]